MKKVRKKEKNICERKRQRNCERKRYWIGESIGDIQRNEKEIEDETQKRKRIDEKGRKNFDLQRLSLQNREGERERGFKK
jgi:hypothetical protein